MDFLPKSCVVFLLSLMVSAPARAQRTAPNGRAGNANDGDSVKGTVRSNIDLSSVPCGRRETWRFIATQGPPVDGLYDEKEPGQIQLCLRARDPLGPLRSSASHRPERFSSANDFFMQPHYLDTVKILYPRGTSDLPLLFVQTASLHAGNGSHMQSTQVLSYANSQNRFVRIYQYTTGTNNTSRGPAILVPAD